jgi:UDP-GlcNAc:undecaprenyl-phosphate GlcNAc-1-phosphate transferase
MMISNTYLMIFAVAMTGCVLATPLVTWVATWVGAIDRPDHFRRIHKAAIPRLGGLALALGVAAGTILTLLHEPLRQRVVGELGAHHHGSLLVAVIIILCVGFIDDTRSLGPRLKLLGQALAVLALYLGGIRIQMIDVLGLNLDLGFPSARFSLMGFPVELALPSLIITLLWFLGCMNVWNLIDGMDGLASGVGLLVSGTLTLVAIHNENFEVAALSVALAGSLAGFLLYNWHPACIFLGDSGSLLIGLLIGVIGVEGSMEGPSAISILFPILAMGLPISDTAMAIFRRWVRNLPLSAADRRHVHHLLIGLGLNQRQAALLLYCFSGFLCGAVMLGVALRNEYLTLVMGISGCLVFLLVVTSRRDELTNLRDDLQDRLTRRRQERQAAKLAWDGIGRIEVSPTVVGAYEILEQTAHALGCELVHISWGGAHSPVAWTSREPLEAAQLGSSVSGPSAVFRLSGGRGLWITVSLGLAADTSLAADIVFRYLQRLSQALAERLERSQSSVPAVTAGETGSIEPDVPRSKGAARELGTARLALGRLTARIGPMVARLTTRFWPARLPGLADDSTVRQGGVDGRNPSL